MAADSRTPHTDALATLGMIIDEHEKRDAIHLGVEPIVAGEDLLPGWHVGLKDGQAVHVTPRKNKELKAVGIVDPFLTDTVLAGERFWLIVYPRQITSLRHVWEHPDFPLSGETSTPPTEEQLHKTNLLLGEAKAVARDKIERIADDIGASFDELMEAARNFVKYGEYWSEGGRFEGEHIPDDFWAAYETYTGEKVDSNNQYSFLSCAC